MDAEPFYRKPWFGTLAGVLLLALAYLWVYRSSALLLPTLNLLIDVLLFGLALLGSAALASQFVLPVRTLDERRKATARLMAFVFGQHGPVTFVENGRSAQVRREDRSGPGVVFVDPASAAVLRTSTRFTRAIGPGLTFTTPGERLAEAIDVRRHVRSRPGQRPRPGDPPDGASTLALTRDGVPIAADLSVTFMLDPGHTLPPREGRSPQLPPYEVNLQAAERATYGHAYGDGERDDLPWTELPLRLVIDSWREEVKRHRLEELVDIHSGDPSPVDRLQENLQRRLAGAGSAARDGTAAPPSKELQILAARGIRILSVTVGNLVLPDRVQEQRMERWRQDWRATAGSSPAEDRPASELDAWHALTSSVRAELDNGASPDQERTLQLIVSDAIDLAGQIDDPSQQARRATDLRAIAAALGTPPAGSQIPGPGRGGP